MAYKESTEWKFEELEITLQKISGKSNRNYNNNKKNSPLLSEILNNCISNLEKELTEKDAIRNFLLKQKSETNNNTSSVNKTVIENDEILETERGSSSPSSDSKQKEKLKQNLWIKKIKSYWLGNPW